MAGKCLRSYTACANSAGLGLGRPGINSPAGALGLQTRSYLKPSDVISTHRGSPNGVIWMLFSPAVLAASPA